MKPGRDVLAVVPSFGRPAYLHRAVLSLIESQEQPVAIWVVYPETDSETANAVLELKNEIPNKIELKGVAHAYEGHMGPLLKSSEVLRSEPLKPDWVYVMDDDARVSPDLLGLLLDVGVDQDALGVGSRVVNYLDNIRIPSEAVDRVGEISNLGTLLGGFHCQYAGHLDTETAVRVRHLAGGSMLWRAGAWAEFNWDLSFNRYIARRYEVYLGEQMLRQYEGDIWYVPSAVLHHYPAPRAKSTLRYDQCLQAEMAGYNWSRILLRFLPLRYRFFALIRWFIWGDAESPGPLRALLMMLVLRPKTLKRTLAGFRGRCTGVLDELK